MSDINTTSILVSYNGQYISPTPIVNYTQQPVSFGYIYGYNTEITLDGQYTGISNSNGTGKAISGIATPFTGQFKTLKVESVENGVTGTLYQWDNVTINTISLDSNYFFNDSFLKYSVKLSSYLIPSGVIEPSNEYSFVQNDDGTATVNHKISARAVRNSLGAFNNAVNFVKQFTGKDAYANCTPYFIANGSGILQSISENINRADAIYSVSEIYRYNTGEVVPRLYVSSLNTNETIDSEYRTIDYNVKVVSSPITKNTIATIQTGLHYDMLADISNEFNLDTSKWVKTTYSANIDSGTAIVDIKVGYTSGANTGGYFEYVVLCEKDYLTSDENWKIDGEFKCFGPLDFKYNQIQKFKLNANTNTNPWSSYLTGLIVNSPIYTSFHDSSKMFSQNFQTRVEENTGLAIFKLSTEMKMGYEPTGISDLKYSLKGSPSRWIYELLPAANIEGGFVIQDLQTKTKTKQEFTLSCKSYSKNIAFNVLSGYMNSLVSNYVDTGDSNEVKAFLIDESVQSGIYDLAYNKSWLGEDKDLSSGIINLQSIGYITNKVPVRTNGYMFGY